MLHLCALMSQASSKRLHLHPIHLSSPNHELLLPPIKLRRSSIAQCPLPSFPQPASPPSQELHQELYLSWIDSTRKCPSYPPKTSEVLRKSHGQTCRVLVMLGLSPLYG